MEIRNSNPRKKINKITPSKWKDLKEKVKKEMEKDKEDKIDKDEN